MDNEAIWLLMCAALAAQGFTVVGLCIVVALQHVRIGKLESWRDNRRGGAAPTEA